MENLPGPSTERPQTANVLPFFLGVSRCVLPARKVDTWIAYTKAMSNDTDHSIPDSTNVESFNLDHRAVAAPYVRVADRTDLPGGDTLIKYDVRFTQPNVEHLQMDTIHSLEHMSADLMRNHTDRLIDFSPMGCQTGFYALTLGLEMEEFLPILEQTMKDIGEATQVPAANEVQCGWGANHSLEGAQLAAKEFLAERDSWETVFAAESN